MHDVSGPTLMDGLCTSLMLPGPRLRTTSGHTPDPAGDTVSASTSVCGHRVRAMRWEMQIKRLPALIPISKQHRMHIFSNAASIVSLQRPNFSYFFQHSSGRLNQDVISLLALAFCIPKYVQPNPIGSPQRDSISGQQKEVQCSLILVYTFKLSLALWPVFSSLQ